MRRRRAATSHPITRSTRPASSRASPRPREAHVARAADPELLRIGDRQPLEVDELQIFASSGVSSSSATSTATTAPLQDAGEAVAGRHHVGHDSTASRARQPRQPRRDAPCTGSAAAPRRGPEVGAQLRRLLELRGSCARACCDPSCARSLALASASSGSPRGAAVGEGRDLEAQSSSRASRSPSPASFGAARARDRCFGSPLMPAHRFARAGASTSAGTCFGSGSLPSSDR